LYNLEKQTMKINWLYSYILYFIFIINNVSFGQNPIIWNKTIGDRLEDKVESTINTSDGGYLLVGSTRSKGAGGSDAYIIKLDATGTVQWEKTYGDGFDDYAKACLFDDGGYVIIGIKEKPSMNTTQIKNVWIFKINPAGQLEWEKLHIGSNSDVAFGISKASEGNGYYIAASREEKGDHDRNCWLFKVNNTGKLLWQNISTYRYLDDEPLSIITLTDGFAVAGYQDISKTDRQIMVAKYDDRGSKLWEYISGNNKQEYAYSLTPGYNNDIVVLANNTSMNNSNSYCSLLSIDQGGKLRWEQKFETFANAVGYGIQKANNGFLITGTIKTNDQTNAFFIKTDNYGSKLSETILPSATNVYSTHLLTNADGNGILSGYATNNGQNDAWIAKINTSVDAKPVEASKPKPTTTQPITGNAQIIITQPMVKEGFQTIVSENTINIQGKVISQNGVSKIKLNGKELLIEPNGNFNTTLPLQIGNNNVTIVVSDKSNGITEKNFSISRAYDANSTENIQLSDVAGKYYALIIGIEEYQDPAINNLDFPIDDAEKLYTTLTTQYTFSAENVILMKNPTYKEIINTMDVLSSKITENDNLLIFYAGHGYWDETKQQGYWLPSDAQKTSTANWLRNSTLRDFISGVKSKHTLLIADACFSGGIFKTRSAFTNNNDMSVRKLYDLPSRKAMTSGALKEVPDQSAFLEYLNKRLVNNSNKYISSEVLFIETRPAVLNNSSNVPQYGTIKDTGDEGGEFIFIRK